MIGYTAHKTFSVTSSNSCQCPQCVAIFVVFDYDAFVVALETSSSIFLLLVQTLEEDGTTVAVREFRDPMARLRAAAVT